MTSSSQSNRPVSVLLVDDSAVVRGILHRTLGEDRDIHVVETASNGQQALEFLRQNPVDVVVLDIEMPVMDGLTALPHIVKLNRNGKVLIASTLSQHNAEPTLRALQNGAADYVPKPTGNVAGQGDTASHFRDELLRKVRALGGVDPSARTSPSAEKRPSARREDTPRSSSCPAKTKQTAAAGKPASTTSLGMAGRPGAIGIGSSTGGPQALFTVLNALAGVEVPILITQHMPAAFTSMMATNIGKHCNLKAYEARDGQQLEPGAVYLAPGDYHMVVDGNMRNAQVRLLDKPPQNFCKPSVDPMFKSMVGLWGRRVLAVVLTGMGCDGLDGCRSVSRAHGTVIAQDKETSTVWGMPGHVAEAGLADAVKPLNEIGPTIARLAGANKEKR